MIAAGSSRAQIARTLSAAYAEGLISEHTHAVRLEQVLAARLIEPTRLIGDLHLRVPNGSLRNRISVTMTMIVARVGDWFGDRDTEPPTILALDWSGTSHELVVGRSQSCDIVCPDLSVSRRHARLINRDGKWVLQDLASTNGTVLNGHRVGRCELRPGDELFLGQTRLRVD